MKTAPYPYPDDDPRPVGQGEDLRAGDGLGDDSSDAAAHRPISVEADGEVDRDLDRDLDGEVGGEVGASVASPTEVAQTAKLIGVSVRRPDGEIEVHSMAKARRLLFQDYDPIREPMAYQGQPSKPGWRYTHRLDSMTSYESKMENRYVRRLNHDPSLVAVCPQPFRLHWQLPGQRKRRHVPDYFVLRNDGTGEVIDVKGSRAAHLPDNALVFAVTRRACAKLGLRFTVASEVSKAREENYAWLAGYAHLQPRPDLTEALTAVAVAPIEIRELIRTVARETGVHELHVKAATFHLLWARTLTCDLEVPFESWMLVERTLL